MGTRTTAREAAWAAAPAVLFSASSCAWRFDALIRTSAAVRPLIVDIGHRCTVAAVRRAHACCTAWRQEKSLEELEWRRGGGEGPNCVVITRPLTYTGTADN